MLYHTRYELSKLYLFHSMMGEWTVIPFLNGNYHWSLVHLPFTVCEAYSVITNVDYRSTDSNSQLLNRVQTVILNF
jgi:hypothetical protein